MYHNTQKTRGVILHREAPLSVCMVSEPDTQTKNRKGGSGKLAGVEVYTAPAMQAHFQLAIDWHSDECLLEMLTVQELSSCF